MSDLQPSHFLPLTDNISRGQATQWDSDAHIDVDESSGAYELNVNLEVSSADESSAEGTSACGQTVGEHSGEEFSFYPRWTDERYRATDIWINWLKARLQGTLPLALSARIPPEVFEFVIDKMDPPTLITAAQVCAAWYPRAMHNIYYTVKICSRTSFNVLFKQCQTYPTVKQWLASTCKLVVGGDHEHSPFPESAFEDTPLENKINGNDLFLQALPVALAGLMPRVRIMFIKNARLHFIHTDFPFSISRFQSIKSLTLRECRPKNLTQLWRIVSAFPQLTDLTMQDITFTQQSAQSDTGASLSRPPSHMRLRSLDVYVVDEYMPMFVDWMTTRSDLCASLADLTYRSERMAWTSIQKLLETAGASLTRYREGAYDHDGCWIHGHLSQNTALRSFDFCLDVICHEAKYQWQVPRAAWTKATDELHSILSTIQSRQLEHIKLVITICSHCTKLESEHPDRVLEMLDLQDLYEVMSRPYFNTLQVVEVTTEESITGLTWQSNNSMRLQKIKAMFHGILQPWSARGIVTVYF